MVLRLMAFSDVPSCVDVGLFSVFFSYKSFVLVAEGKKGVRVVDCLRLMLNRGGQYQTCHECHPIDDWG
jgi:hypothetical protein